MNEKEYFAEKLRTTLLAKGYDPKASVIEREFNLRHYSKRSVYTLLLAG